MRGLLLLPFLLAAAPGCTWCVDQCLGGPTRPGRAGERRAPDPCDVVPGSLYRAANGDSLRFDAETVEWRHDGVTELLEWRCRDAWLQFRDRDLASDARLRGVRELHWNGVVYLFEGRP